MCAIGAWCRYASHCLEHGDWAEAEAALLAWRRVLARGGHLSLAVPHVPNIGALLVASEATALFGGGGGDLGGLGDGGALGGRAVEQGSLLMVLYGAQRDATDTHKSGFTYHVLAMLLRRAGFCGAAFVPSFHRFASDSSSLAVDGVPISLNVRAVACAALDGGVTGGWA